jgi:WD40 repeat protein
MGSFNLSKSNSHLKSLTITSRLDILADQKFTTKINDIQFIHGKSGLIASLSNGSVAFWSHDETTPEFILDCHDKSVNKIIYDESIKILFTCSSDKTIKVKKSFFKNIF